MKVPAIGVMLFLYLVSGIATSGLAFCVTENGSAGYEWSEEECCGDDRCEGESDGPVLEPSPECGGCVSGLMPPANGALTELPVHFAPVEIGIVLAENQVAVGIPAVCRAAQAVLHVSLPLRC